MNRVNNAHRPTAHLLHRTGRVLGSLLTVLLAAAVCSVPAAASAAGVSDAGGSTTDSSCGQVSATLVPSCGAWWGVWPRTDASGAMMNDLLGNVTSLEGAAGRKFDIVSRYYGWNQQFPDQTDFALRDTGHHLLIDVRARDFGGPQNGAYTRWSDIASGSQDAVIDAMADRVKAFGSPVFFSFNQEPEFELEQGAGNPAGSAADYAAAYRHIHDVFAERGVTNAIWVWWVMGYSAFDPQYASLYPGDSYVDWISYDPYDFNTCHNAAVKDPYDTFANWYRWIDQAPFGNGKPLMLSEYGSNGAANGQWYAGVADAVKQLPRIKAVVEFDSSVGGCDTRVTASAENWAGFVQSGRDDYFNQSSPATSDPAPQDPAQPPQPQGSVPPVDTRDLVVNGDFAAQTSGWYASAGTLRWFAGAARISHTGVGWADLNDRRNTVHSTGANVTYCAAADVRAMAPTGYARLRLMEYSPANKFLGSAYASVWLTDKRWRHLAIRYRARSADATLDLNVLASQLNSRSVLIDNVTMGCD